jgi:putative transposase
LSRIWNRIPDDVRERIVNLALNEPALSPRELAVRYIDTEGFFCLGGIGVSAAQGA